MLGQQVQALMSAQQADIAELQELQTMGERLGASEVRGGVRLGL